MILPAVPDPVLFPAKSMLPVAIAVPVQLSNKSAAFDLVRSLVHGIVVASLLIRLPMLYFDASDKTPKLHRQGLHRLAAAVLDSYYHLILLVFW